MTRKENYDELTVNGKSYATELPFDSDENWHLVGTVTGFNTSVHCLVTESSRNGGPGGEPGYEIVHYRIGNNATTYGGTHVEFSDPDNRVRESEAKIVYDSTTGEWGLYYKVSPNQTGDFHVYPDSQSKEDFTFSWTNEGPTEPTGDSEYTLDRQFNVVADLIKTDGDIETGGTLRGAAVDADDISATNSVTAGSVDADGVQTDQVNQTFTPAPGELLDAVSAATADDVIRLHSGESYDPGAEIHVPSQATLDCNGAVIEPSTDYPVIFADTGCHIKNLYVRLPNPSIYTSNIITLDGDRATGRYNDHTTISRQMGVNIQGRIDGNVGEDNAATAVKIEGSDHVSLGSMVSLRIKDVDVGFHADNTSFVQGPRIQLVMARCRIYIDQGPDCLMNTFFYGAIQNSGLTEISIRNQNTASESGPTFFGAIWDPHVVSNAALVGESIKVFGPQVNTLSKFNDGSEKQSGMRIKDRGLSTIDIGNDVEWEWQHLLGMMRLTRNGSELLRFDEGQTRLYDELDLRQQTVSDLKQLDNATSADLSIGEFAFDANVNGTGNPAWLFKDSTNTVHYWTPDNTL